MEPLSKTILVNRLFEDSDCDNVTKSTQALQVGWTLQLIILLTNSNCSMMSDILHVYPTTNLTLVLLNKLRCHALFEFSASQIT